MQKIELVSGSTKEFRRKLGKQVQSSIRKPSSTITCVDRVIDQDLLRYDRVVSCND